VPLVEPWMLLGVFVHLAPEAYIGYMTVASFRLIEPINKETCQL